MAEVLPRSDATSPSVADAQRLALRAAAAQPHLAALSQDQIDHIVERMAHAAAEHAESLAELAVEETGYGVRADKVLKNRFAAETIYEFIRPMKTVGVIRRLEAQRVVEIAEPFGVVAAVVPSTNPTSTAIYKLLIAMKARCTIVLSPHPTAIHCITRTASLLDAAAREAGAPEGAISWMTEVTLEGTQALMRQREVAVILATGGMGLVRAAYSAGKPAYGVGPGNAPAYIERSADIDKAVRDIITGKTFDNGLLCSSENSVVVDREISDAVRREFAAQGGHFLNKEDADTLAHALVTHQHLPNPDLVGRTALEIANRVGIAVPDQTVVLLAPLDGVGRDYPLSIEKLCPVLSFYVVDNWREGCERCQQILRYGGMGHTMSIHSSDESIILEFGLKKAAFRIVVNTPTTLGSIGMTTGLDPSMTLGCGGYGGNITSDNISPRHLLNIKRLAYETKPVRRGPTPQLKNQKPTAATAHTPLPEPPHRPASPKLDPRTVADRVATFLESRGVRRVASPVDQSSAPSTASGTTVDQPPHKTDVPAPTDTETSESAVEFVSEEDVRVAVHASCNIIIDERTIITPAARDLAKQYSVFIDLSVGRTH